MDTDDLSLRTAKAVLLGVFFAGYQAYHTGRLARGWQRLCVWALGGAMTLEEALGYTCALCGGSLDARDEVRTLSCDNVFHRCESKKCKNAVDVWLREDRVACPTCRKVALPVSPWNAPSPSASSSGSHESTLPLSTMASGEDPLLSSPVSEESSSSR